MVKLENLVIVDEDDMIIGTKNWKEVHEKGILHRGVVVFIFNDKNQLLITQRSVFKDLWPLYWDASCATHVYKGESYIQAGERRLPEELGIHCNLTYLLKTNYISKYENIGIENEICALLVGKYNREISPNPEEVNQYKWISYHKLEEDIHKNPEKYTPWLRVGLKEFKKYGLKNDVGNTNKK